MIEEPDYFVGEDVCAKLGLLALTFPVVSGVISNWDTVEKLWHYAFFSKLRIAPEEVPCLLTESPFNGRFSREKATEILFETFSVPALRVAVTAELSLLATGRTTGLVLDIGHTITHSVPLFEGCILPFATQRQNVAGGDLTAYLNSMLETRGYLINTNTKREVVGNMKETMCYFACDESSMERRYVLPDGSCVVMNQEWCQCPEALFQPSLLGKEEPGLHEMLLQSIKRCNVDIRQNIYSNLLLSGGSSLFPGLKERLAREIQAQVPAERVNVLAPPDRKHLAWVGGSILASLATFGQSCVTKEDYDEFGPTIIHRKL